MSCVAEKVTALIVRDAPVRDAPVRDAPVRDAPGRETAAGRQLLLFRHPTAGVQVPAGTVEEGEAPEAAALREGQEESGLSALAIVRHLETVETVLPDGGALIGSSTVVYSRPDTTSWDWAHLPRGGYVDVLRRAGEWVQIDFREGDRFPDTQYDTFRLIGWVPAHVVCPIIHRHFYLLTPTAPTPDDEWAVAIDYHVFRPLWASLDELLATDGAMIIESQRHWINPLRDAFNATPVQPRSPHPLS